MVPEEKPRLHTHTTTGIGVLTPFWEAVCLKESLPAIQKKLVFLSLTLYPLFTAIVVHQMIFSNLRM